MDFDKLTANPSVAKMFTYAELQLPVTEQEVFKTAVENGFNDVDVVAGNPLEQERRETAFAAGIIIGAMHALTIKYSEGDRV